MIHYRQGSRAGFWYARVLDVRKLVSHISRYTCIIIPINDLNNLQQRKKQHKQNVQTQFRTKPYRILDILDVKLVGTQLQSGQK
jgi:hypothetical protein